MTRPLEWLAAIRDHPNRPPVAQCRVLDVLALRLNWSAGTGFVSTGQLSADSGAADSTVRRALGWARGTPRDQEFFLAMTRRGHRLGDGTVRASEWLLRLPSQPVTRDLLNGISTGQQGNLNRSNGRDLNRSVETPHLDPRSSRPRASAARKRARAESARAGATETTTPFRAPPCPECGKPFGQEQLTDPGFREMALAGEALHAECSEAASRPPDKVNGTEVHHRDPAGVATPRGKP